jgi:hypothetical protein
MLMSHIFAARPIMTSCAEFIVRWTSLFLSSLGTFYCALSDSFAVGVVLLSEDECTSVTYLYYTTHIDVPVKIYILVSNNTTTQHWFCQKKSDIWMKTERNAFQCSVPCYQISPTQVEELNGLAGETLLYLDIIKSKITSLNDSLICNIQIPENMLDIWKLNFQQH